jgi:hypothetical protein
MGPQQQPLLVGCRAARLLVANILQGCIAEVLPTLSVLCWFRGASHHVLLWQFRQLL